MFIQKNVKHVGERTYRSTLLVERYRQGRKVKSRTLANLSKLPTSTIDAIDKSLKGQLHFVDVDNIYRQSGKNFGGIWVIKKLADILGISDVLGNSRRALLVLIMVAGRILTQGSRRHLTFWREGQALEKVFEISTFDEDDLYEALDWLELEQERIEKDLFAFRYGQQKVTLFLYDISSSYLEGEQNELARYGYNRDGKRGKKQIVLGLLTDKEGFPIAVEVFEGNTSDSTTVDGQVKKLAQRFGVTEAIFVGDRGMIKTSGIEALKRKDWHYITAITKAQIESLICEGVLQLELFDESLVEITHGTIRYLLRRNPVRAKEVEQNRQQRMEKIEQLHKDLNQKLMQKPRSKADAALRDLCKKIDQLRLSKVYTAQLNGSQLDLDKNVEQLSAMARLDGCYVIKTNVDRKTLPKEDAHRVYKQLSFVEQAFRTLKTGFLEIRPLFHRKANRTRACAVVAMLAYMILFTIEEKCQHLDIPLASIIEKLDQIQTQNIIVAGHSLDLLPSTLRNDQQKILDALELHLPKTLRAIHRKKPFRTKQTIQNLA